MLAILAMQLILMAAIQLIFIKTGSGQSNQYYSKPICQIYLEYFRFDRNILFLNSLIFCYSAVRLSLIVTIIRIWNVDSTGMIQNQITSDTECATSLIQDKVQGKLLSYNSYQPNETFFIFSHSNLSTQPNDWVLEEL